MHVLLAEGDPALADGISRLLKRHGMAVDVACSGEQADLLLRLNGAEVMILDASLPGLPGIGGFEVLRRLRSRDDSLPVLVLTTGDSIPEKVQGFELGADDCLVKPFAAPELVARLKALVRRSGHRQERLQVGGLELDVSAKRARVNGQPIKLLAREWDVLEYLMRNASRVVSRENIIVAVAAPGQEFTPNAVEVNISRLRPKIGDAKIAIRSIRGVGYMLVNVAP